MDGRRQNVIIRTGKPKKCMILLRRGGKNGKNAIIRAAMPTNGVFLLRRDGKTCKNVQYPPMTSKKTLFHLRRKTCHIDRPLPLVIPSDDVHLSYRATTSSVVLSDDSTYHIK